MNDHGVLAFSNNDDQTTLLHKGVYLGLLIPYTTMMTKQPHQTRGWQVILLDCALVALKKYNPNSNSRPLEYEPPSIYQVHKDY